MRIETRALGPVEATPESFVTMPDGILGYDTLREFALVAPADYAPFLWLLSFDDPSIAFPVLPARQALADYQPTLAVSDARSIGAVESDAIECYVLAAHDSVAGRLTVNLRAPIMLNPATRLARQVVLSDGRWTVDHRIAGPEARDEAHAPGEASRQAA